MSARLEQPLNIGFTFDQKSAYLAEGYSEAECIVLDSDETIESIASALSLLGNVDKIGNIKSLVRRLAQGQSWDVVFNMCEGLSGSAREAQVPSLLEAHRVNHVFFQRLNLLRMHEQGDNQVRTYQMSLSVAIASSVQKAALETLPLFVKPACECSGQGVDISSLITREDDFPAVISSLTKRFPEQDLLVEKFLSGREFTVGIIGTAELAVVIGVTELVFRPTSASPLGNPHARECSIYGAAEMSDWQHCPHYIFYDVGGSVVDHPAIRMLQQRGVASRIRPMDQVIADVSEIALRAWHALGCRDGGRVDVRYDRMGTDAKPHVIKVGLIQGLR
ncbi:hypothetical protein PUNSTDRAFT_121181 [Punctularia strigosozonata HHB-11173 SS5]|uniref:uncharacterized protein n=1 Tax=Punctularia strigosozonata (strain HHB-11173) TaxID=741275 RepID=UPI00044185B9|nr:uncharacterized protein PUNSTDRAFT_121181 [Punctularia strigosozonata HHB-11173 SS5]EIN08041.1 hypothetical protein PUNSTDRAFT_121181 [Punctularia strigosozonata HHB-11173 SS5]